MPVASAARMLGAAACTWREFADRVGAEALEVGAVPRERLELLEATLAACADSVWSGDAPAEA